MLVIHSIIFSSLLSIAWQDFKYKAVYWWLFILLMIGLSVKQGIIIGIEPIMHSFSINCLFLASQLLCLTAYISIRERRLVDIFKGHFGLGDLFFLIGASVYFSFLNFVVYYSLSLVVVILTTIAIGSVTKQTNPKIPLAGYQAIVLLFFIISSHFFNIDWSSDQWLSNYINA